MKTLKKILCLLTPHERKQGFKLLILVLGMALLETAGIASVMPFLAVLGNPDMINTNSALSVLYAHGQNFGVNTPDNFLIALGIIVFMLTLISAGYRTFTLYATTRYIEMRRYSIGTRLLESYLNQPYAFFLDRHSGEMSKTVLSEIDQLVAQVFRPIFNMIAYCIVFLAITFLLIYVNPWLAFLAAGLFGGLYTVAFVILKNKLAKLGATAVASNRSRFVTVGESLSGIKDIKMLGCEQSYLNLYGSYSKRFATTVATQHTLNQVPKYLIEAIAFGGMIAIILVLMISSGGLGSNVLGEILPIIGLYAFAAYRLQPALQAIFQGAASLRYGQVAVDNIFTDLKPHMENDALPNSASQPLKAEHSIVFQDLSYSYNGAKKPALIDLNFEIPIGSTIGLIGTTGAGKTTLVDVFLGLLRPKEGAIIVDGIRITEKELRAWQNNLGYVSQEIFLTDSSIAQNIALGIPPEQIDQEQVKSCARMAQVHDFIQNELPQQYETLVGERGVRLSGGQRQRIGIARALYRNPEILVLDEATSALDTATEESVMEAIDALSHQKTIIIIAHRLSTVKKCDQILLLERGKIKARGSFDEIIQNKGDMPELTVKGV